MFHGDDANFNKSNGYIIPIFTIINEKVSMPTLDD